MSAPSIHRTTRRLAVVLAAVPAALALTVLPASALPTEGDPVTSGDTCWRTADGRPAFPGHRYGCFLPPAERGPVMEFLEP